MLEYRRYIITSLVSCFSAKNAIERDGLLIMKLVWPNSSTRSREFRGWSGSGCRSCAHAESVPNPVSSGENCPILGGHKDPLVCVFEGVLLTSYLSVL
jgi:hypothetical protein